LSRFFKWLNLANPRPVSTRFAGNVGQYIGQRFFIGDLHAPVLESLLNKGLIRIGEDELIRLAA
jgi:hypothetical protein